MFTVNLDKASKNLGHDASGRTDYQVFVSIAEYMDGNGVSTVRQSVISQETGYARRTVSTSIHRLQDKSLLTIEKTIKNNTGIAGNIYHINSKYLMKTEDAEPANVSTPYYSATNDVRRLARLGEVLADVVKNLLQAYENEEKNK